MRPIIFAYAGLLFKKKFLFVKPADPDVRLWTHLVTGKVELHLFSVGQDMEHLLDKHDLFYTTHTVIRSIELLYKMVREQTSTSEFWICTPVLRSPRTMTSTMTAALAKCIIAVEDYEALKFAISQVIRGKV